MNVAPSQKQTQLITEDITFDARGIQRPSADHDDWVFILLLAAFALLGFVQVFYNRRLKMIFQAVYARHYASQLIREGNIFNERVSIVLFLIYLIGFSAFLYEGLKLFSQATGFVPDFIFYLKLLAGILLVWIVKVAVIQLTGMIFTTQKRSFEYLLNAYMINLVIGLFLIFLLLPMIYLNGKVFFYIGMGFLLIMFVFRLIKGITIGFSFAKFSRFHLFLYLCTLEILPLAVLIKFLTTKI
jgi:hypothetical protein